MRSFQKVDELLIASPAYLKGAPVLLEPAQLAEHQTLDYAGELDRNTWELVGPQGEIVRAELKARMVCHDFIVLRAAVLAGLGIARLPESVVREDLKSGKVARVLPQWNSPQGIVHVVFPSRRGMLPAVRAFIDFLAEHLPGTL
jgi:DNA-binding transcriptional LysR family regulator